MKKAMLYIIGIPLALYVLVCLLLYFFQEKFIFFPEKLPAGYRFPFKQNFSEVTISARDGTPLHILLFRANSSKGVVFYLHGNAGSLRSWGEEAAVYTDLGYDVWMMDYRGYGKSGGKIRGEKQLHEDVEAAYSKLLERYAEEKIIVIGYSLGTGLAAFVAAAHHPRMLILQAPYYSLPDVMREHYPVIPIFLLKYRLETYRQIQRCTMPVVLIHGRNDEVIPYQSSLKLKVLLKPTDRLVTLENGTHNGMSSHPQYKKEIKELLSP
jgi:pimeloyl-ACP methyl ester carboxylesterase